jgi:hypothetical protein
MYRMLIGLTVAAALTFSGSAQAKAADFFFGIGSGYGGFGSHSHSHYGYSVGRTYVPRTYLSPHVYPHYAPHSHHLHSHRAYVPSVPSCRANPYSVYRSPYGVPRSRAGASFYFRY